VDGVQRSCRTRAGHHDLGRVGHDGLAIRGGLAACQREGGDDDPSGRDGAAEDSGWRRRAAHQRTVTARRRARVDEATARAASERDPVRLRSTIMAPLKPEQIIALLIPIVVIQLALMVVALVDLEREERRVRGGSKLVWAVVIVFVNIIGPIVYFMAGREE
jgi:hypothetical protein